MDDKELERRQIVAENIKNLIKAKGITQKELAKSIGMSQNIITEYVKLRSFPPGGVLQKIADYFGVKKSDIDTTWKAEVNSDNTPIIVHTIETMKSLHTHRQEKVLDFAQAELTDQNKENTIKLFPYNVQEKLSAGTGYGYFDDGNYDTVYYNEQYDYDFASWIFGDSMLPDYPNGDVALIKACPFEYDGCVYAVDWDGQSYIKKVYKEEKGLRLVSTNEKYSDKFAPFTEEPRIIGKVVGSFTPIEK